MTKSLIKPFFFSSKKEAKKSIFYYRKNSTSLLRDYYIYAGFILAIALSSSIWSAIKLYNSQKKALEDQLITQSQLIDTELNNYFNYISHIIEDKGHKIALHGGNDLEHIAYLFKRNFFFPVTKLGLKKKAFLWPHFSWIDKKRNMSVKSEFGVLSQPQRMENEKYLYQSTIDNWQLHLSDPYYDSFKERIFINAALGVANIDSEEYIGSITTKFDVGKLVKAIKTNLKENTQFVILNEELKIVIQSDSKLINNNKFFISTLTDLNLSQEFAIIDSKLEYNDNRYKIYKKSYNYPFIVLTGYNYNLTNKEFLITLFRKIIEVFGAAFFILAILFFQRQRIIKPINHLACITKKIAKGVKNVEIREHNKNEEKKKKYPLEIHELREGVLLTKIFMDRERRSRKSAEESKLKLAELNDKLQHQNESAKKSKKSREKFLSELRRNIVEDTIVKMTKDIATILDHQEGNIAMTKQTLISFHKKMLDNCAKILSDVSDNLNLSYVNAKEIIEEAIEMNNHDADINHVELISKLPNKIADIYIDKRSIKHVIAALINYAMEDRRRNNNNSFIKITAQSKKQGKGKSLQIIFEDNGHGISEEMRMNFQQNSEKRGKSENNIALSLYAIRYILTLHKATLQINNTSGKGSIITVNIPYRTPETIEEENQSKTNKTQKEPDKIGEIIELFPDSNS